MKFTFVSFPFVADMQAYSYHVLADTLSLFVGLLAVYAHRHDDDVDDGGDGSGCGGDKTRKKSPVTNTYGWVRVEPVGALISHIVIISLSFRYIYTHTSRL